MKPIDADVLKKRIERMKKYDNQKRVYIKDVLKVIDGESGCSTVKEVVLCHNCQFWYAPFCLLTKGVKGSNFYCADGRSKL